MEAASGEAKIDEMVMEEDIKEAGVKDSAAKATDFLSLLVGVCTYRCKMF